MFRLKETLRLAGPSGCFGPGDEVPENHPAFTQMREAGLVEFAEASKSEIAEMASPEVAEISEPEKAEDRDLELADEVEQPGTDEVEQLPIEYPRHVGRGLYELSSGDRVRGKEAAAAAEAALGA